MYYKDKQRTRELLLVVGQALKSLDVSMDEAIICETLNSIELVQEILKQEHIPPNTTLVGIGELMALLQDSSLGNALETGFAQHLYQRIMTSFDEEVESKLKIAFLPYKASMWDSLESIYFAAARDESCDVTVVPIPYYKLSEDGTEPSYEGEQFPSNIPITHYSNYDLEKERPDIVFVHNIYDQYNTLTRVYDEYFTSNLKKYTDMLVYVPYCLFSFVPGSLTEYIAYKLPSMANVDKVILLGEHLRNAALDFGIPDQKILVLGSPKLDKITTLIEDGVEYPPEWRNKIDGKTVFLLDTHLLFFSSTNKPLNQLEALTKLLNIPNFVENSVLIWRPHPLTRTALAQYSPLFLDYYLDLIDNRIGKGDYVNVIFDDSADYFPALLNADVYIGGLTSLMFSYLVTNKPIMLLESDLPESSLIPSEVFNFFYDKEKPWVDTVRVLALEAHSSQKQQGKILQGIYVNIDGSSGRRIYDATKKILLEQNVSSF